jgi:poly-gamma-glutamate capsule biosynthesis protein CapA/YwtB (metallophosphatase superfamily)
MAITIALAGDTMLGRGVAVELGRAGPESLVSDRLVEVIRTADVFVLNLECCISDRGSRWPDPDKPFFFRAPPIAIRTLTHLGVSCVTLANNHALDFGREALMDTIRRLREAGIATVGAGADVKAARAPAILNVDGLRLAVFGFTDHPSAYAAGPAQPGVAFADLRDGVPGWLLDAVRSIEADAVLVTSHWGPNMVPSPIAPVRAAARQLVEAGVTLVAGHSAHVFQGVDGRILFDLGDFLDDYATDPELRNDLGLVFLVTLGRDGSAVVEAVPIALGYCGTDLADGGDARWIAERFDLACRAFGTTAHVQDGRLRVVPDASAAAPG